MIFGIGIDIFSTSRLDSIKNNINDPYFIKSFTLGERDQAIERADPIVYYATRFAGKEAVFKAISRCGCEFRAQDIEIIDLENGQPIANISGRTYEDLYNYEPGNLVLHISLSYELENTVAVVVAELI